MPDGIEVNAEAAVITRARLLEIRMMSPVEKRALIAKGQKLIEGGLSTAEAAAQIKVGRSTLGRWITDLRKADGVSKGRPVYDDEFRAKATEGLRRGDRDAIEKRAKELGLAMSSLYRWLPMEGTPQKSLDLKPSLSADDYEEDFKRKATAGLIGAGRAALELRAKSLRIPMTKLLLWLTDYGTKPKETMDDQKRRAVALLEADTEADIVARTVGVPLATVHGWKGHIGKKKAKAAREEKYKSNKVQMEKRMEMVRLIEAGKITQKEAAKRCGVDTGSVWYWVNRMVRPAALEQKRAAKYGHVAEISEDVPAPEADIRGSKAKIDAILYLRLGRDAANKGIKENRYRVDEPLILHMMLALNALEGK